MRATVVFNQPLSPTYRHLGLEAPEFPVAFRAGQFVMVRPEAADAPFLPRAFSIYRLGAGLRGPVVEILYKMLGKGTQCLARLESGKEVDLLGPLGNHFTEPGEGVGAVLVAGGIGVPPIAALAAECGMRHAACGMEGPRAESHPLTPSLSPREGRGGGRGAEPRPSTLDPGTIRVFLGGRTSEDILCVKDFEEAGAEVRITTEDGSLGARGLVTGLLEPFLRGATGHESRAVPSPHPSPLERGEGCNLGPRTSDLGPRSAPTPHPRTPTPVVYACGPPGMLRAVAALAERYGVPCQTSVEAPMACGFGACMGCAIEVRGDGAGPSYKLVCKDGPVFDSREIVWGAEA